MSDANTPSFLQDTFLRPRERGAEVWRIPGERQNFPLGPKKYWIAFVEVPFREAARPSVRIVMENDRVRWRTSGVHMGTASEMAKTHMLQSALELHDQL